MSLPQDAIARADELVALHGQVPRTAKETAALQPFSAEF